jgi:hypothetical protein
MSLAALIAATGMDFRIEDVLTATGGESEVGEGEKVLGYVVRLRDNRRFQLRAWRNTNGMLERPEAMQLPTCL